ncbi:MAG: hypothetical protein P8X76_10485, partial [Maritimibacter sp.]
MTKRGFALTAVLAMTLAFPAQAQDRSFTAEGSDAIFAMGARHIAMGGTGTSTADDALAVFYNPARLAGIRQYSFSGTRQLDATLRPYTFIGGTAPLSFLEPLGIEATLGVARYNRVHARSSGAFAENEFESIFLRYLLPGVSGTFDGDIDSKTLVNRFALGARFDDLPGLSIGANVDWIDCKTNTCGMHAGSHGYEVRTVHATALSFGVSAAYQVNDRLSLGVNFTDVNTELTVHATTDDDLGLRVDDFSVPLPRKLNAELSYRVNDHLLLAAGYQKFWGTYGNFDLNIETAHFGAEYESREGLIWRGGAWMPLDISASNGLNLDVLPFPFAPTIGVGMHEGGF